MRGIYTLILSLGLGGLLAGADLRAQDAPKPLAIKVVTGADGSIKIIDLKTGKELDDAVIKLLAKPGAIQLQPLDKKQIDGVRKAIDKAIELEFTAP